MISISTTLEIFIIGEIIIERILDVEIKPDMDNDTYTTDSFFSNKSKQIILKFIIAIIIKEIFLEICFPHFLVKK